MKQQHLFPEAMSLLVQIIHRPHHFQWSYCTFSQRHSPFVRDWAWGVTDGFSKRGFYSPKNWENNKQNKQQKFWAHKRGQLNRTKLMSCSVSNLQNCDCVNLNRVILNKIHGLTFPSGFLWAVMGWTNFACFLFKHVVSNYWVIDIDQQTLSSPDMSIHFY